MTKETLKQLIEIEFDRVETVSEFKKEVFRLIDLYESDRPFIPIPGFSNVPFTSDVPDEVPYGMICSCNPANGGSGVCGCIMGNKMVKNPKKYGGLTYTTFTSSTDINLENSNSSDTITSK
jgi:hypothetical protein